MKNVEIAGKVNARRRKVLEGQETSSRSSSRSSRPRSLSGQIRLPCELIGSEAAARGISFREPVWHRFNQLVIIFTSALKANRKVYIERIPSLQLDSWQRGPRSIDLQLSRVEGRIAKNLLLR
ncbi:uncharacterized protein LOC117609518 [Osmia lignaria lignaria]|uniref:uncharacterized protein LOC117609518 n=1 Tax=Osmia lignaria lignaria TaxID=1437193 RepID=UPI00402B5930